MFVVWGKKLTYQKIGYVADFCPLCCVVRPFSVERVGVSGHMYYVSVGKGELAGYQRMCAHCRHVFNADANDYAAFAEQPLELPALINKTYPNIIVAHRTRLSLESELREGSVAMSADARRMLIAEPFHLLSHKLAAFRKKSGLQFERTFIRREIIPVLGNTLARLKPTQQELQNTLRRLTQLKDPLGAAIKLPDLVAELAGRYDGSIQEGIPDNARGEGGVALDPHQKAARILWWLGVLSIVALVCMLISFGMPYLSDREVPAEAAFLVMAGALGAAVVCMGLHNAVRRRKQWACAAGMAVAAGLLFLFPIGTIVGGLLLWHLVQALKTPAAAAQGV